MKSTQNTNPCVIDQEHAQFEAYMFGREHPVIGWIDSHWFRRGDDPATYANDYVQGAWVMWQARASLPVGVPDGYALVPINQFESVLNSNDWRTAANRAELRAMLAAAAPTVKAEQADCLYCQGHGEVTRTSGQTPESYAEHNEECPECEGTGLTPSLPAAGSAVEVVAWGVLAKHPGRGLEKSGAFTSRHQASSVGADWATDDWQVSIEPLMTVAQKERIVAALLAELQTERSRADAAVGGANDAERALSAQQSAPERVSVPRELLNQAADFLEAHSSGPSIEQNISDELRALLSNGGGV